MSRSPTLAPLVAAVVLSASSARAEMDEWQVSLGAGYRAIVLDSDPAASIHAPGLTFGAWFGLDDYWQLGGSAQLGLGLPVADFEPTPDPALVGSVAAEVRYVLDIVEWVPHLAAGVGGLWNDVGDGSLDLILGVGLGIDYRPARDWSVGFAGRYDFVITDLDGVSATFHLGLVYSFHFSAM